MIGIDIVNIDRIKSKHNLFTKIFSSKELEETNKYNLYTKIAGKWAAKEAAVKAGIGSLSKETEIITENGKPVIYINNKKNSCMVSISHDSLYATAIVFCNENLS